MRGVYHKVQQSFDEFLKANWPKDVPTDCTRLDNQLDCFDHSPNNLCLSCKTYEALSGTFHA